MALSFEKRTGHDASLNRDALTVKLEFQAIDTLPKTVSGDYFDYIASAAMSFIRQYYPTYTSPFGTLFWNSIKVHENHYAQNYHITVTYSPFDRQTGSYMIRVEQAVGMEKATAGRRIAGYPAADAVDNGGLIWDGEEVTGTDVPVAEDRIVVSYRHPQAFLIPSYIRAVGKLRGYPNNDTFLGYDPGEVLYMGGDFSETDAEATAQYTFHVSPNVTDLSVAGITVTEKKGWDVISPVYKQDTDDDAGGNTKPVKKVDYIEVIRPAGREWKDYASVFGWGG